MSKIVFSATFLLLLVARSWAAEIQTTDVAGWAMSARSDDKTGEFSHCVASGDYKSGITLFAWLTSKYELSVGFAKSDWKLKLDKRYPLRYRYDGGVWLDAEAVAITEIGFALPAAADSTMIALFRRARLLEIKVGSKVYGFELGGTSRMVAALANCVQKYSNNFDQSAASNAAETPANSEAKSASGTGIVVTQDGGVLTNNHVVKGCGTITVAIPDDVPRGAQLVRADATNDLALLRTASFSSSIIPAKFREASVEAGENVAVFGFPLAGTLSSSGNIVSGNITSLAGLSDDARFFQISTPIQPGNSGGPLLDMSGNVIGVVTSKLDELVTASNIGTLPQNVNFAIKGEIAKTFLEAHSVSYANSTTTAELPMTQIVNVARRFTVQILCNR